MASGGEDEPTNERLGDRRATQSSRLARRGSPIVQPFEPATACSARHGPARLPASDHAVQLLKAAAETRT